MLIFAKTQSKIWGALYPYEMAVLYQEQERKIRVNGNLVIRQESLKLEGDEVKAIGISQHILVDNALEEEGEGMVAIQQHHKIFLN